MSFPNKAEQVGEFSSYSINPNDIGSNWKDLGLKGSSSGIDTMSYLGNGISILGGAGGHIFRSVDYGVTWSDLGAITTVVETSCYLGNGITIFGDNSGHIFRSTNFGVTWTDLGAISGSFIRNMEYFGNGIAVFSDSNGHLFRSTNFGANWTDLGAIGGAGAFGFNTSVYLENGIAIFGSFRTTDFGLNWTSGTGGTAPVYLGNGIVLFGTSGGAGAGHIFRSVDYGLTFTDLGQMIFFNTGNSSYLGDGVVIFGIGSHIFRSINYGLTWVDLGVISGVGFSDAAYLGNGVVIASDNVGHVFRSDISYKLDENIPTVSVGISGVGNTSGTTGLEYQRLVIAGGTNVTLSQSITSGSATITINAATASQSVQTQSIVRDVVISGNTSGTTADITSGTLTLAGGSNITLSQAGGNAITIIGDAGAGGAPNLSIWQNSYGASAQNVYANFNTFALVELNPSPGNVFPGNMTVSTMLVDMSFSVNSTVFSASHILGTLKFGIYTLNASTLSILNSVATTYDIATLTTNLTINLWASLNSSLWSASPTFSNTQYYLGYIFHSSSGPHSISLVGDQYLRSNLRSGTFFGTSTTAGNTSRGHIPYVGVSVSSRNNTTALPPSIALSQLQKSGSNYAIIPHLVFMNVSSDF